MSDVLRLIRRQLAADLRGFPVRAADSWAGRPPVEKWHTVSDVRDAARRALPKVIFDFIDGGANDEATVRQNRADFNALKIAPHILVDVGEIDCATTVLGQRIASPIIGAPTGLCGLVHHHGELALANAVHRHGSIYTLAAMASYSIEEVAAQTSGPIWFQSYVWRDTTLVRELLARAEAARMSTLLITVDVPRAAVRDRDLRNGFGIPPRATARSIGEALRRPRWTWNIVRRPRLVAGSVASSMGGGNPVSIASYVNDQFEPAADWNHLVWFREHWQGNLVVKGVLRPEDATRAVSLGADAVIVSNHGGRQLDHAISTITALPAIVDAVGDDAEVLLDGGVRRGSDVLKALALGARACLVGRPIVFGLGAGGEPGAARVMELLGGELRAAMMLAGVPRLAQLDPSLVRCTAGRSASPNAYNQSNETT